MSLEENGKDQVAVRGDRELISDLTRIVAGFCKCNQWEEKKKQEAQIGRWR
jgi:hypothetical protein